MYLKNTLSSIGFLKQNLKFCETIIFHLTNEDQSFIQFSSTKTDFSPQYELTEPCERRSLYVCKINDEYPLKTEEILLLAHVPQNTLFSMTKITNKHETLPKQYFWWWWSKMHIFETFHIYIQQLQNSNLQSTVKNGVRSTDSFQSRAWGHLSGC